MRKKYHIDDGGGGMIPHSEVERQLTGSWVTSFDFKHDSLVEKSMSVTIQGVAHHLVSHRCVHDLIANKLRASSLDRN